MLSSAQERVEVPDCAAAVVIAAAGKLALIGSVVLALGLATGCGRGPAPEPATPSLLDEIVERGRLTMLSFPHQESAFVRTNLEMGPTPELGSADHFVGVDVDLMTGFAEHLGVELEVRRVSRPEYGALIPDLLADKADLIASSFSITPERQAQVDFSDPYFSVYPVIVPRVESSIAAVEDLQGLNAAAIAGSSHEEHLLELGVSPEQITYVSFTQECFSSVAEGLVDFTLHDSNSSLRYLRRTPELRIAFRLPGEDGYGFAVRPGSDALLDELNGYLSSIRESGRLDEILESHLPIFGDQS
jgi:polar amino acid transport system substrate-binding protein